MDIVLQVMLVMLVVVGIVEYHGYTTGLKDRTILKATVAVNILLKQLIDNCPSWYNYRDRDTWFEPALEIEACDIHVLKQALEAKGFKLYAVANTEYQYVLQWDHSHVGLNFYHMIN